MHHQGEKADTKSTTNRALAAALASFFPKSVQFEIFGHPTYDLKKKKSERRLKRRVAKGKESVGVMLDSSLISLVSAKREDQGQTHCTS